MVRSEAVAMVSKNTRAPIQRTTRKNRILIQLQYLVNAIPPVPTDLNNFTEVKGFLVTCTIIVLGASKIFEKIDLGDDLDSSLNGLILLLNNVTDTFLTRGKLVRHASAAELRDQLHQFFCTFHETVQRLK